MQVRVTVLTNIISPYRIPFFNALSTDTRLDLTVIYVAEQEHNRSWPTYRDEIAYSSHVLHGLHLRIGRSKTLHLTYGLYSELKKASPQVLVIGTNLLSTTASLQALCYARAHKCRVIRFEGMHDQGTGGISRLRRGVYRLMYTFCDHFFVYSPLTREFLRRLGIPADRITVGYNVGHTEFFRKELNRIQSESDVVEVRDSRSTVHLLFVGELTKRKGFDLLLKALLEIDRKDLKLVAAGEGPEAVKWLRQLPEHIREQVSLAGHKDRTEIAELFFNCDIFVLPSVYDPASIVLSEALHSGLIVVASRYDGSAWSLVREGENGIIVDPLVKGDIARGMGWAIDKWRSGTPSRRQVQATVADFDTAAYARRLAELVICLV